MMSKRVHLNFEQKGKRLMLSEARAWRKTEAVQMAKPTLRLRQSCRESKMAIPLPRLHAFSCV